MVQLTWVQSLIAYDCRGPATNITTISLLDVAQCPDEKTAYIELRKTTTVLQRVEVGEARVHGGDKANLLLWNALPHVSGP